VPLILGGGDVLAAAETGSGKTGAFALPVLQIVHETLRARQQGADSAPTAGCACWLYGLDCNVHKPCALDDPSRGPGT